MWRLLFRRFTRDRLHELDLEVTQLKKEFRRMDADVTAKWNAMKDVVKAAESVMDSLKRAADWLRSHTDEGAKELAADMDAVTKELSDKVASVAASGDVS